MSKRKLHQKKHHQFWGYFAVSFPGWNRYNRMAWRLWEDSTVGQAIPTLTFGFGILADEFRYECSMGLRKLFWQIFLGKFSNKATSFANGIIYWVYPPPMNSGKWWLTIEIPKPKKCFIILVTWLWLLQLGMIGFQQIPKMYRWCIVCLDRCTLGVSNKTGASSGCFGVKMQKISRGPSGLEGLTFEVGGIPHPLTVK